MFSGDFPDPVLAGSGRSFAFSLPGLYLWILSVAITGS